MLEGFVAGNHNCIYDHEKIEYGKFDDPILIELKERWPDLWEGPVRGLISQDEQDRIFLDYARRLRAEPLPKDNT
jgi:hypothetical protein